MKSLKHLFKTIFKTIKSWRMSSKDPRRVPKSWMICQIDKYVTWEPSMFHLPMTSDNDNASKIMVLTNVIYSGFRLFRALYVRTALFA